MKTALSRLLCISFSLSIHVILSDDISAPEPSLEKSRDSCSSTIGACAKAENDRHNKDGTMKFKQNSAYMHDVDLDTENGNHEIKPDESDIEVPKLTRVEPGQIGDVVEVELEDGKFYQRITRARNPPVFEVPNYLSVEETKMIIAAALDNGMETSGVLGEEIEDECETANDLTEVYRVSEQSWLSKNDLPEDMQNSLSTRLQNLVQLPTILLDSSEQLQVVSYTKGGHFHAHMDTSNTVDSGHLKCCFQAPECYSLMEEDSLDLESCCRVCRYVTVLYYLSDVEEGGETAFPLADISDELLEEKMMIYSYNDTDSWSNLSYFCHKAPVVVKPNLGTAIMWYNHYMDEKNGYLGESDFRSFHGGCDVMKGSKWIANNWITASPNRDKHISYWLKEIDN